MTNQEFLISCMKGGDDDGGATWESTLHYHIACPYSDGDKRAHCNGVDDITRDLCVACKNEWLSAEVEEWVKS